MFIVRFLRYLVVFAYLLMTSHYTLAQLNTFEPGQPIRADEMNQNFESLRARIEELEAGRGSDAGGDGGPVPTPGGSVQVCVTAPVESVFGDPTVLLRNGMELNNSTGGSYGDSWQFIVFQPANSTDWWGIVDTANEFLKLDVITEPTSCTSPVVFDVERSRVVTTEFGDRKELVIGTERYGVTLNCQMNEDSKILSYRDFPQTILVDLTTAEACVEVDL